MASFLTVWVLCQLGHERESAESCVKHIALPNCTPSLSYPTSACRLRDVMFLDLALEMTGKGALESGLAAVRSAAPSTMLGGLLALLQQPLSSACMSALPGQGGSAALVAVAGQLAMLSQDCPGVCVIVYAAMLG